MNDFISQLLGPEIHPVMHARAVLNLKTKDGDDKSFCDEQEVFSCPDCVRNSLHLDDFYFRRGQKVQHLQGMPQSPHGGNPGGDASGNKHKGDFD
jgi:hypothetical protein